TMSMDDKYDILVVKIGMNGNVQWVKTIGKKDQRDIGRSIMRDFQGNIVVLGYTNEGSARNIVMTKLKKDGTLIKSIILDGQNSQEDYGWDLVDNPLDKTYIITGWTRSANPDLKADLLIFKIKNDLSGVVWSTVMSAAGKLTEAAYSIYRTTTNDYVVTGFTESFSITPAANNTDMLIAKFDNEGKLVWAKVSEPSLHLNQPDAARGVAYVKNTKANWEGYAFTGYITPPTEGLGGQDALLGLINDASKKCFKIIEPRVNKMEFKINEYDEPASHQAVKASLESEKIAPKTKAICGCESDKCDWRLPIDIKSKTGFQFIRTLGGHSLGTAGYDDGLDLAAAPTGMTYYAYFARPVFPNYFETDICGWVDPYTASAAWELAVVNAKDDVTYLSWDPDLLPDGRCGDGCFLLKVNNVVINMRMQNSFEWKGNATFKIVYQPAVIVTYTFPTLGWYLVSLPLYPEDDQVSTLFPTAIAAFGWNGTIYVPVTKMEPTIGYWILLPGPATSKVRGCTPLNSYTKNYKIGWHLIGATMGTDLPFANPDDVPDNSVIAAFYWDSMGYIRVYPPGTGKLNEKVGYWLGVIKPCTVTIPGLPPLTESAVSQEDVQAFQKTFGTEPPAPPVIAGENQEELLPEENQLSFNYPNPFNPVTTIKFSLAQAGMTELTIYNVMGQPVRTLLNREMQAGLHEMNWDGRDEQGEMLSGGVYFYQIKTRGYSETRKMVLLK
ncbi:T9SS type A sorting domain-containing protein, partial [candidate division KSB1 bacterium]|nr:T9SS type A sorting domain-containing protein [candidate division KSB1 bacterium]